MIKTSVTLRVLDVRTGLPMVVIAPWSRVRVRLGLGVSFLWLTHGDIRKNDMTEL